MVGLLGGVSVWEHYFLENAVPGIYWLFVAYGKIAGTFSVLYYLTVFLVVLLLVAPPHIVGIFGFFRSKPMWARHHSSNSRFVVIGRLLLSVVVGIGSLFLQITPLDHIDRHIGTVYAKGSVYHLAYRDVYYFLPQAQYILAKCDRFGLFCRQLDNPPASYFLPYWEYYEKHYEGIAAEVSLYYDPAAGRIQIIQVIQGDTTIYTYQP